MNYDTVISELITIINSDFDIQSLVSLKKIYVLLGRVYRQDLIRRKSHELSKIVYEKYLEYTDELIWNKLKEKLDFEDEIINRIMTIIKNCNNIDDIYVLDGNVIVKSIDNKNDEALYVAPEYNFVDITSNDFIKDNKNNQKANFIIMSINNTIKSLIQNKVESDDILLISNGNISYTMDNLNIYAGRNMNSILADNTGSKVTKILVVYENKLLYFDLKIRDNYVILSQNDYKINILSEMLNKKEVQKAKK